MFSVLRPSFSGQRRMDFFDRTIELEIFLPLQEHPLMKFDAAKGRLYISILMLCKIAMPQMEVAMSLLM